METNLNAAPLAQVGFDTQPPQVTVQLPTAGTILSAGQQATIQWVSWDNVGVVAHDIKFSSDGGNTFPIAIVTGLPGNQNYFLWTVPPALTNQGVIRVIARDAAGNQGGDRSGLFSIQLPGGGPVIISLKPDSIQAGATYTLKVNGQSLLPGTVFSVEDVNYQPVYGVTVGYPQGSPTEVILQVNVASYTTPGSYFLVVRQPGIGTARSRLTITAPKAKEYKEGKEKEKEYKEKEYDKNLYNEKGIEYPLQAAAPMQPMVQQAYSEPSGGQMHFIPQQMRPDLNPST